MKQERGGGGYANLVDRTGETEPLHAPHGKRGENVQQPFLHALLVVDDASSSAGPQRSRRRWLSAIEEAINSKCKMTVLLPRQSAAQINKSTPWLTLFPFIDAYFQYICATYSGCLLHFFRPFS